jgi:hypothetical protein
MLLLAVFSATLSVGLLGRGAANAASSPSVYLAPPGHAAPANTAFSVQIRENSGTTAVNAIQANLSYSTSLYTLNSIDYTGTAFGTAVQSSGSGGVIKIARGTPCSTTCTTVTGDKLVATLKFTTTNTHGGASISFTSGTALVNASTHTDILGSLSNTTGGTFYSSKLAGDYNNDCRVDILDGSYFISYYGVNGYADLNGNNTTDIIDGSIFISNYGTTSTGC